jgi:TDG/mug DNA glycosylase family protein
MPDENNGDQEVTQTEGFLPIIGLYPKILILGTFPGPESLRLCQYYAHSRNLFWDVMGDICNAGRDKPYEERLTILKRKGIALWDVLKSCCREGSLDANIREGRFTVNDFHAFFLSHPLKAVFFNGKKASTIFRRHVRPKLSDCPPLLVLPSTSPANTGSTKDEKFRRWIVVKDYLS